ncbi:MAG TPA: hypothetical protein VNL70_02995 [Tepidisphaeraceae bacterium]|nr:hypothetical protein [Tepidisphaeraceae bacterium]
MGVGHLKVVCLSDGLAVADPGADHVDREALGQFRLTTRPQVVEQLGPGRQPGPADDPLKLRPQVRAGRPVARDDVLIPRLGLLEDFQQVRTQFREDRNPPFAAPCVMLGLAGRDAHPAMLPVDVAPLQRQVL